MTRISKAVADRLGIKGRKDRKGRIYYDTNNPRKKGARHMEIDVMHRGRKRRVRKVRVARPRRAVY